MSLKQKEITLVIFRPNFDIKIQYLPLKNNSAVIALIN